MKLSWIDNVDLVSFNDKGASVPSTTITASGVRKGRVDRFEVDCD